VTRNATTQDVLSGAARWCVVEGDSLALFATLPDACVDAVVSDPPYGTGQWQRAESGAGADCRAVHCVEEWDVWDPAWIDEALRVSRGPVLSYLPNGRIEEMLATGRTRHIATRLLLWCKTDPRPRFSGQPAFGFEPVIAYRVLLGGEVDWFAASAPRMNRDHDATGHPHQKPIEVDRWLVRLASKRDDVVFVPHGGSGTTGVAAIAEGRRVILCERVAEYADMCRRRCEAAAQGTDWRADPKQGSLFGEMP
jgi:site-specific DNA-methyltransferase (adenine-specific)